MSRSRTDRNSLVRAAIASLVLHFLAVPFFGVASATYRTGFAGTSGDAEARSSDETTSVTMLSFDRGARRIAHTSFDRPRPHRNHVPLVSKAATNVRIRATPQPQPQPMALASTSRKPSMVRAREPNASAEILRNARGSDRGDARGSTTMVNRPAIALTLQTAAPERTSEPARSIAVAPARAEQTTPPPPPLQTPSTTPSAMPATEPAVAVALNAHAGELQPGGWGQSFAQPLVADDALLAALRAKFRGIRAIAIDVDADGRATRIAIPASVTGDAREELARALSAARYVPAECNGLRCTGTLQLVL